MANLYVFFIVLVVSGCADHATSVAKHLDRGKAFLVNGNYQKARIEFKNVLQIDHKNTEAYVLLGEVEEGSKNWRGAFTNYNKAITIDPSNIKSHARLGRIYLLTGDLDGATRHMTIVLSANSDDYDGLMLQAVILDKNKQTTAAVDVLSKILLQHPDKREAIALLANIYIQQNKLNKAATILETGLKYNKDNIQLQLQLAQIYVSVLKMDKAEALLSRVIELEPEDMQHRINLSTFYVKRKRVDDAEKVLRHAVSEKTDDEYRYLLLVDFLDKNKGSIVAQEELSHSINIMPESIRLRFALAGLYDRNLKVEQAIHVYNEIIKLAGFSPDALRARNSLAALLLRERRQAEADKFLDEVLNENPNDYDALKLKGKLALSLRDLETAINYFRRALKYQPDSFEVVNLLSTSQKLNNEPEMARQTLQRFLDVKPNNVDATLKLTQYMMQDGEYDDALSHLDKVLIVSKSNLAALQLKAVILQAKQEEEEALEVLLTIQRMHPSDIENYKNLGDFYLQQGKHKQAINTYQHAMDLSGKQLPYLALIVKVYLAVDNPDAAIGHIGRQFKVTSDEAQLYVLLAEVYISTRQFKKAKDSLDTAIKIKPGWNLPYSTLAKMQFEQGNKRSATKTYILGLNKVPGDERLSTELAGIYENHYEHDKAVDLYESVIATNPGNMLAANNLAYLLAVHKGGEDNLQRALELTSGFESSRNPVYLDTLGWVHYKTGNIIKAAELLNKAVKAAPDVPHFNYHLGMTYYASQNPLAKKYLAKALESDLRFPGRDEAERVMKHLY